MTDYSEKARGGTPLSWASLVIGLGLAARATSIGYAAAADGSLTLWPWAMLLVFATLLLVMSALWSRGVLHWIALAVLAVMWIFAIAPAIGLFQLLTGSSH